MFSAGRNGGIKRSNRRRYNVDLALCPGGKIKNIFESTHLIFVATIATFVKDNTKWPAKGRLLSKISKI